MVIASYVFADPEFTREESEKLIFACADGVITPASIGILSVLHATLHGNIRPFPAPLECLDELSEHKLIAYEERSEPGWMLIQMLRTGG